MQEKMTDLGWIVEDIVPFLQNGGFSLPQHRVPLWHRPADAARLHVVSAAAAAYIDPCAPHCALDSRVSPRLKWDGKSSMLAGCLRRVLLLLSCLALHHIHAHADVALETHSHAHGNLQMMYASSQRHLSTGVSTAPSGCGGALPPSAMPPHSLLPTAPSAPLIATPTAAATPARRKDRLCSTVPGCNQAAADAVVLLRLVRRRDARG